MGTDSATFFVLLVLTIVGTVLAPDHLRKYVLIASSAIFYVWAGAAEASIVLALILVNYAFASGLQHTKDEVLRTRLYFASIALNVAFFFAFKLTLEPLPGSRCAVWHPAGITV